MSQRAFALTESAKDSFVDASVVTSSDGHSVSIGERLKEGNGYIVTDNEQEINALLIHPALKTVAMSEAEEAAEKQPVEPEKVSAPQVAEPKLSAMSDAKAEVQTKVIRGPKR